MWWIQVLEMDSRAISNYAIDLYRSWMGFVVRNHEKIQCETYRKNVQNERKSVQIVRNERKFEKRYQLILRCMLCLKWIK